MWYNHNNMLTSTDSTKTQRKHRAEIEGLPLPSPITRKQSLFTVSTHYNLGIYQQLVSVPVSPQTGKKRTTTSVLVNMSIKLVNMCE